MSDFFKFPSTPHLAVLEGVDVRGDKAMSEEERNDFLRHEIVVEEKGWFFSVERRNDLFEALDIVPVPHVGEGRFTLQELQKLFARSSFGEQPSEGLYLRRDCDQWLLRRAKLVRPAFVQSLEEHWTNAEPPESVECPRIFPPPLLTNPPPPAYNLHQQSNTDRFIKSDGGTGPAKSRQPSPTCDTVPIPAGGFPGDDRGERDSVSLFPYPGRGFF